MSSKLEELRYLYGDWAGCTKCPLCAKRKNTVFADGSPEGPLMIISDKPGRDEDRLGIPLVGSIGKLLGELIASATGREVEDVINTRVHLATAVMCRPEQDRQPTPKELEACWPRLREQIRIVDPWLIVTLGGAPFNTLIAGSRRDVKAQKVPKKRRAKGQPPEPKPVMEIKSLPPTLTRCRGELTEVPVHFPGYGMRTLSVLPTFHPTYLMKRPDMNEGGELKLTLDDVQTAFAILDDMEATYAAADAAKHQQETT